MLNRKGKAKQILIVEDEKDMQEIYRDMFHDENGYEIDIAAGVEEAIKRIQEKAFDLVILDIIMEPMTGDSFCIYLRENLNRKDIPVIVVSVLEPSLLGRLKKISSFEFLQKPIKKGQLFQKIEEVLS